MQYTYTVILRQEPEGGYTVLVPALRGCVTWGRNVIESLEMAREAIECYLESLAKHGEAVPEEGPVTQRYLHLRCGSAFCPPSLWFASARSGHGHEANGGGPDLNHAMNTNLHTTKSP
jgi:antitoxin HicB